MKISKGDIYFLISLLTAIYAALISFVWTYFINLIIGIPVLLLSYLFWKIGKTYEAKLDRYKYIPRIWMAAIVIAIVSLIGFLITN